MVLSDTNYQSGDSMNEIFHNNFYELRECINNTDDSYFLPALKCIEVTKNAILAGNKVMLCGNGGSASTASHITNDFIGHMNNWTRRGYPAISLTADISVLTALTNDYGYDEVFKKQVGALGKSGDILWTLSTSGNSKNIIAAVEQAKIMGITAVAFTGKSGGKLRAIADLWVPVNTDTPMLAEALHLFYFHSIAESIEAIVSPINNK
jgi:D-sedoheptulose 7-phosphate isomerase